jgi:hypothetical protein
LKWLQKGSFATTSKQLINLLRDLNTDPKRDAVTKCDPNPQPKKQTSFEDNEGTV